MISTLTNRTASFSAFLYVVVLMDKEILNLCLGTCFLGAKLESGSLAEAELKRL